MEHPGYDQGYGAHYPHDHQIPPPAPAPPPGPADYPPNFGAHPPAPYGQPPAPGQFYDYGYPAAPPPLQHNHSYDQQPPPQDSKPRRGSGKRRSGGAGGGGYQPEGQQPHPQDPYLPQEGYPPHPAEAYPHYPGAFPGHPDPYQQGPPPGYGQEGDFEFLDHGDWPAEGDHYQEQQPEKEKRKKKKKKPAADPYDEPYPPANGHGLSPPRAPTPPKAPGADDPGKKKSKRKTRREVYNSRSPSPAPRRRSPSSPPRRRSPSPAPRHRSPSPPPRRRSPSPPGRRRYHSGTLPLAITPPPHEPTPPPEEFLEASSPHSVSGFEKMRDPISELERLKFSPRTSAAKHLSRFEKLVERAYPKCCTDGLKWELFAKTLEVSVSQGWSGGRGITPWKWMDEIEKKGSIQTYSELRVAFMEQWGRGDRERRPTSIQESQMGGVGLGSIIDENGSALPLAPEPPGPGAYDFSDSDREEPRRGSKPTTVQVAPGQRNGQIVLTIGNGNDGRNGRRRDKPVQVVLDTNPNNEEERYYSALPTPKAVEAPPMFEEEMPPLPPPAQIEAPPAPSTPPPAEQPTSGPLVVECSPEEVGQKSSTDLASIAEQILSIPHVEPRQRVEFENGRPRLLEGKIVAITGCSRGIGRALAIGMAKEGANIVAHYWGTLNDPANDDIVSLCVEIRSMGQGCSIVFGDIADPRTSEKIVKLAVETYGRIDIAVNNAGMCWLREMDEVTPELFMRHTDVNLTGPYFFVQAVSQQMKAQYHKSVDACEIPKDYSILSISSSAAVNPSMQTHFLPSSVALQSLMRSSAASLGSYGIRCNSLLVGVIRTKMNIDALKDLEIRGRIEKRVPLGRIGKPEDVVGPAVMLVSEMSRYVSGAEIRVDGGMGAGIMG